MYNFNLKEDFHYLALIAFDVKSKYSSHMNSSILEEDSGWIFNRAGILDHLKYLPQSTILSSYNVSRSKVLLRKVIGSKNIVDKGFELSIFSKLIITPIGEEESYIR